MHLLNIAVVDSSPIKELDMQKNVTRQCALKWGRLGDCSATATEWLRHIETTHCHVLDVHVSLSLQLGYYLPVEPLELQGGKEAGPEKRKKKKCLGLEGRSKAWNGWSALWKKLSLKQRNGECWVVYSVLELVCGGERLIWGCAYEWVRNKAWEIL